MCTACPGPEGLPVRQDHNPGDAWVPASRKTGLRHHRHLTALSRPAADSPVPVSGSISQATGVITVNRHAEKSGVCQGKDQPVGAYVYTVIVESYDNQQRSKTGSFRLLR